MPEIDINTLFQDMGIDPQNKPPRNETPINQDPDEIDERAQERERHILAARRRLQDNGVTDIVNLDGPSTIVNVKQPNANMQLTERLISEIEEHIRQGNYIKTACALAGITPAKYYAWLQMGKEGKHPMYVKFYRTLLTAEAHAESQALRHWQSQIPTDWHAAKEFLDRRFPKHWQSSRSNSKAGKGDVGPVTPDIMDDSVDTMSSLDLSLLSDEEVTQLETLVRKATKSESYSD